MVGIERYINPIDDGKISLTDPSAAPAAGTKKKAADVDTQQYITNPQTRVQTKNPNFGKKIRKASTVLAKSVPTPKKKK